MTLKRCPNVECPGDDDQPPQIYYGCEAPYHVWCEACGMRGPFGDTPAHAEDLWNGLPRDPVHEALSVCICGDTGQLPVIRFDADGEPISDATLPCPRCNPQEDIDA